MKRFFVLLLTLSLLLSGISAIGLVAGAEEENDLPWLEYTVDIEQQGIATGVDNPNDVVTPWIENKFHIRVKDVVQGPMQTIDFQSRLGAMLAANNLPDVIIGSRSETNYAISTGKYADLTEYIDKMENLNKYFPAEFWPRFMHDGKKYVIPVFSPDVTQEPYKSDPYTDAPSTFCLWAREDLLKEAGYTFKTLKELEEEYTSKGIVPPDEAYAIEPAIDSPEAFQTMLEKIAALDKTVGDTPLIPFSSSAWTQFHIGSMFDFGHWRIDDNGEVDGYLGTPGAKDYYKYYVGLYRDGLLDADFIIDKEDQLQQKIASGRVAAGMYIPDVSAAQEALYETVGEDAVIRYIKWPKQDERYGAFDVYEGGFWRCVIRADFPDIERLTQYFDWFYSDEGFDMITWGPEEAGLWEIVDGVKKFKDPEVEHDMLNDVAGGKGPDYYGLYNRKAVCYVYNSRAAICAPMMIGVPIMTGYNPASFFRSYPATLDIQLCNKAYASISGVNFDGRYAYGNGSQPVNDVDSWYWGNFTEDRVAKLLLTQNDEEFDKAWEEVLAEQESEAHYSEAKAEMTAWFAENAPQG